MEHKEYEYSNDRLYSFYRTRMELFFGQVVDDQLLDDDRNGALRREITMYEDLIKLDDKKFSKMFDNQLQGTHRKNTALKQKLFRDRHTAAGLIYGLLSTTPVFKDGEFDTKAVFVTDDLKKFIGASIKLTEFILAQLEVNTRKDVEQKAVQHLGAILSKVGLKVKMVTKSTAKGKKTYSYALDPDAVKKLEEITRVRSELKHEGWGFVDKQYGFQYSEIDMMWLESKQDNKRSFN